MIDDGVDQQRGLSGLAVPDDQLALPAPDWSQRVDGFDAGLKGLGHRLPLDHRRRLNFEEAPLGRLNGAFAVDRTAKRVNDPAQHAVPHRDRQDRSGLLHR